MSDRDRTLYVRFSEKEWQRVLAILAPQEGETLGNAARRVWVGLPPRVWGGWRGKKAKKKGRKGDE